MATDAPPSPLLPLPLPPGRAAAGGGGGGGGKVRLVRCPKCRGLLPELPNVPLYKCGGCGATLRAKIRNEPPAASIPRHINELENSSSPSSPSQGAKLPSTNANSCLTSPISHSNGCSDKEDTTANHNSSLQNGQLDCRGRKQVSDSEEEADNNNDRCSSPGAQFHVLQGYTAHCPAGDSVLLSPDILFGDSDRPSSHTDSEQLEKSQEIILRPDSEHPSSRETNNTQVVVTDEEEEEMQIPSSMELSNNHDNNDMPELEEEEKLGANAKSFHAYDGSVSSYEGWDDQLHHHQHIRKYTYEFDDSSGEQMRTDVPLNDKVNPRVPLPLRSRKFQSMSLNDDQAKTKMGNNVESNQEPPADTINGTNAQEEKLLNSESFHTAQTSTHSQRMSDKDFYRKVLPAAFENGGPSTSYRNKEFMYDSDSHPVEKAPSVIEHNQDELLRKVDELRDQLIKSYALKLETRNDKFLKGGGTHQQEHERPVYRNRALQREKDPSCYRRNDPWHFSGACPPSNSVPFQGRDSSEMPICHGGYTSLQCFPEQFQYPLQRPPIAKGCYSEQLCQIHPGYMCYHPHGSGPINNSNFAPRVCNSQPLPHGQRHMDHKVEKQNLYPHRDRRNHIKRHCLPVAGGAPIIVCYSCKILLQLPADFILSSNRCAKLRCSSCSEVLIFQLQSGRSVPFRPNPPTVPPPSEVDNHSSNSSSRGSSGFFFSKENNRNRDESSVLDETSRTNSRRILLEKRLHGKEVQQRTSGSPLHSLMGYASPRRLLIKRSSDIDQER